MIGNLGQNAKVRETNGRKAINFTIAENKRWKDDQGTEHEKTTWVQCTYWKDGNQSAAIAEYLKQGTKVYLEGQPEVKTYKKEDGSFAASLNLTVNFVELLGAKPTDQAGTTPEPTQTQEQEEHFPIQNPHNLPF